MSTTEVAKAVLPVLQDYAAIVGEPEITELRELARRLAGRHVKMVNSTAVGGGVAEILNRLVPLMEEVNVPTRWEVITGGEKFFHVTKAFHNALHGAPYEGAADWFDTFLATNEENRRRMRFDEDFIVIHDPQPVALIAERDSRPSRWVWRCHIDLSNPNEQVWDFLKPWVDRYDASLFSSPQFTRGLRIPQYLFFPTIDPLADKNRELDAVFVRGVLEQFHVDPARPILTQISRFDRLKDPVGVIRAYRLVKRYEDCQLVLAGGSATDDPEGAAVLREVEEAAAGDPDIHILNLPPWSHVEINALQRGSTIVIQKSLREGFGLTVSDGLSGSVSACQSFLCQGAGRKRASARQRALSADAEPQTLPYIVSGPSRRRLILIHNRGALCRPRFLRPLFLSPKTKRDSSTSRPDRKS